MKRNIVVRAASRLRRAGRVLLGQSADTGSYRVETGQSGHEPGLQELLGEAWNIQTFTSHAERVFLYEQAIASFQSGKFLEVGSYTGASAVALGAACQRLEETGRGKAHVICVDTWQNDAMSEGLRDTWGEFERNTERWRKYITAVAGDTRTVELPDGSDYDLVFIDGDHSYDGARSDADRFGPLVRVGGLLVMHDHRDYHLTVSKVMGELLGTGQWYVEGVQGNIVALKRVEGGRLPKTARELGSANRSESFRMGSDTGPGRGSL